MCTHNHSNDSNEAVRHFVRTSHRAAELDIKPCAGCCTQAQCILFARYPEVLAPSKYAGYPMLLDAAALPEGDGGAHFLGPERAPRLQARPAAVCPCQQITSNVSGLPKCIKRLGLGRVHVLIYCRCALACEMRTVRR